MTAKRDVIPTGAKRSGGISRPLPTANWELETRAQRVGLGGWGLLYGLELPDAFLELPGTQAQRVEICPDVRRRDFLLVSTEYHRPVELRLIGVVPYLVAALRSLVHHAQTLQEPPEQRGLDLFQGCARLRCGCQWYSDVLGHRIKHRPRPAKTQQLPGSPAGRLVPVPGQGPTELE